MKKIIPFFTLLIISFYLLSFLGADEKKKLILHGHVMCANMPCPGAKVDLYISDTLDRHAYVGINGNYSIPRLLEPGTNISLQIYHPLSKRKDTFSFSTKFYFRGDSRDSLQLDTVAWIGSKLIPKPIKQPFAIKEKQ